MSKRHRQSRRAALRVLYAADVADDTPDDALANVRDTLRDEGDNPDRYWDQVVRRVRGVFDDIERIDDEIRTLSTNWRIERMAAVDRNLLRLGVFEILHDVTPPLVAINACVELAKEFGTASTPGFINGLLDQLCQNHDIPIEPPDSSR